jgi:hypothetical protein
MFSKAKQTLGLVKILTSHSSSHTRLLSLHRPTGIEYQLKYREKKYSMSTNQDLKIKEAISSAQDEPQQIDAIASIRGWFRPHEDSPFYPLIQQYLASDNDLSEITEKLSNSISKEKTEENYLDLCYSILHSAKRIPWRNTSDHTKLVELVKTLKNDVETFQELSYWGMATREVWNDSPGAGAGYSEPEAHAWANINYYLARVKQERIWGGFEPLYGLWAMRQALEEEVEDDGPDDAHKPGTKVEKYNTNVPAAAVWAIVLGKDLYELEKDMTPKEANRGNPAKGGKLWKGSAEFSKERWAFWKKRFGDISELEEPNEETKNIAKEAVERMERAEGS